MLCTVTLPSMVTVESRLNEFQGVSIFDEPRVGAPKTAITQDNTTKKHDLVLVDCWLKVPQITETVGVSKNRVGHNPA